MASLFSFFKSAVPAPDVAEVPAQLGTLRIGLGQLLVEGGEPVRNLARAVEQIAQAAAQQCDLVLLPETLDFAWTHPSALYEAQPIPGLYSDRLCQAAASTAFMCAPASPSARPMGATTTPPSSSTRRAKSLSSTTKSTCWP